MAFAAAALQTDLEDGAIQASPKVFSLGNRAGASVGLSNLKAKSRSC